MAAKPSGLGKGLGALLGDANSPIKNTIVNRAGVPEIDIVKITPNPDQPRKTFDEIALQDLANSIKEHGVIQPITIREVGVDSYQIISGERRFRASQLAGKTKIPAYIRKADDQQLLVMGLVENLQREDLDPIEIAQSYQRLIEEGNLTQEELGEKVGKNHATIANSLRLLKLPPEIQTGLINGDISEGHAKALLSLSDENQQKEIYSEIIDKGLSVRATEELVKRKKESSKQGSKKGNSSKSNEQTEIQSKLESKLKTKVSLQVSSKGNGKITIPFKNSDEMNAIVALLEKIQ
ncbi:MAG: ParB/RepB/Spo0J family partition protein [Bacteroidales bacterium]|nr:ParB/RepB/Spo0J family partition protein [Bacteroidales bacterium]MBR4497603.1 ParB/RepB/Spo0J family partition protein [Bacteroidales bacterium]